MSSYVFGPVPSRRLGRSLGLDLTPGRACSYDCAYCQLTRTRFHTAARQRFFPLGELLAELETVLAPCPGVDAVTFSGSGEPTLSLDLGAALAEVRRRVPAPVPLCVITNGSLLWDAQVRRELLAADRVLPTLTTVVPATFARIHRPTAAITLPRVLAGLRDFAAEYRGGLELEVMLMAGVNDGDDELAGLAAFIRELPRPVGIFLNGPVRPPTDPACRMPAAERWQQAAAVLGRVAPITAAAAPLAGAPAGPVAAAAVLGLLARHPCTCEQLQVALGGDAGAMAALLARLVGAGAVRQVAEGGQVFFQVTSTPA